MDDLDRAILCEFDPNASQDLKTSASTFIEKVKSLPEVWKVAFEKLFKTKNDKIQFWCLQVLAAHFKDPKFFSNKSENDLKQIHIGLFTFITTVVAKQEIPAHIKNKFSEVLVLAFRIEYSEDRWPSFWNDLFSLLNSGPNVIEMFLRIMNTIDQEVVCMDIDSSKVERKRNTLIVCQNSLIFRKIK